MGALRVFSKKSKAEYIYWKGIFLDTNVSNAVLLNKEFLSLDSVPQFVSIYTL